MKVKFIDSDSISKMDSKELKTYFDHLQKVLGGLSNTTTGRNNLRDVISMLIRISKNTDLINDYHKGGFETLQSDFGRNGSVTTFPVVCGDAKRFIRNASDSVI